MDTIMDYIIYGIVGSIIIAVMRYLKIENFNNFLIALGTVALGYLTIEFIEYLGKKGRK